MEKQIQKPEKFYNLRSDKVIDTFQLHIISSNS